MHYTDTDCRLGNEKLANRKFYPAG